MHRWIFHYQPRSKWESTFTSCSMECTTTTLNDASRLVDAANRERTTRHHFLWTLRCSSLAASPQPRSQVCSPGYLFYDTLHYATHHFSMRRGVWLWLKKYHMRHHYQDDHVGFGVTSPLWDHVFGTKSAPEESGASATSETRGRTVS